MRQNFLLKPDLNYFNQDNNNKSEQKNQPSNLMKGLARQDFENDRNESNFVADALIKSNPLLMMNSSINSTSSPTKPQQSGQQNDSIVKEYEREIALQDGTYNMLNQQNASFTPGVDELFKSPNKNQPTWQHTQIVRNFDGYDEPTSPVSNQNKSEESESQSNEEFSRRKG